MSLQSAFDFAKPFDIMVGHWVGTSSTYDPAGTYLFSSKSYVSVYWKNADTLSFRESGEDVMEYGQGAQDFVNPRTDDGIKRIGQLLSEAKSKAGGEVSNRSGLRRLTYDFTVTGSECHTNLGQNSDISVSGRRTRPDAYQFHVKKRREKQTKAGLVKYYHHVFNSHHLASPEDWHIIGPVVGPVWKKNPDGSEELNENGDEKVGLSVVQFFRRISYSVPEHFVSELISKK
jgi:hypothetical protein